MLVGLYPQCHVHLIKCYFSLCPCFYFFFKGKMCVKEIGIFLIEKGKGKRNSTLVKDNNQKFPEEPAEASGSKHMGH